VVQCSVVADKIFCMQIWGRAERAVPDAESCDDVHLLAVFQQAIARSSVITAIVNVVLRCLNAILFCPFSLLFTSKFHMQSNSLDSIHIDSQRRQHLASLVSRFSIKYVVPSASHDSVSVSYTIDAL